ncbi:MAG: nickel-responsive transcriptional regulator NikR [Verrucomicrobiota bacterium]
MSQLDLDRINMGKKQTSGTARRISISLPRSLAEALDAMILRRGFHNRSQAIAEMVEQNLIESQQENEDSIMAGTITLFYDASKAGLLEKLAQIEREHIEECISSQHVLLEGGNIMEVVLVQGPVRQLRKITDRMLTCKGVSSGKLTLTSKIIPQLHER